MVYFLKTYQHVEPLKAYYSSCFLYCDTVIKCFLISLKILSPPLENLTPITQDLLQNHIFLTFPKRFLSKVFYPHFLEKDACHAKCNTYLESPTKLPSEYHIYQLSIRKLNRYHIQTFHIYMKRVNLSN